MHYAYCYENSAYYYQRYKADKKKNLHTTM